MKRTGGLLVLSLVAASPAVAGTTGRLIGSVRDVQGQPLPGANVTVSSPTEIGGAKIEVTDADGRFQFPALSPGYYTVKIELSGFVDQERSEVRVRLERATELVVTMPMAKFADEITVRAETPMVDPTQVSTSQNFSPEFLKGVAVTSDRRDYVSVLTMAPGVASWFGTPMVNGSGIGENVYMIDGLNTTDSADATIGTRLAFDAIQEISFQTGGFEAEYGNGTGGVVNVVTKSGGNDLSGSLDVRYYDTSFFQNGDHFDRNTNTVKFLHPAATLGGPIVRDSLWFFAAYDYSDSQSAPTLSPTTTMDHFSAYLGKLTWQVSPSWRLAGKWNTDAHDIENVDASPWTAPEATTFTTYGSRVYSAETNGVLSAHLLWSVGVGINRVFQDYYPQSGDFTSPGHYNIITGETYGNAIGAGYDTRDRDEYKTNLTWFADDFAGSHELKAGYEHNDLTYWSDSYVPPAGPSGGLYYRDVTSDYWYGDGDQSPIPFRMWKQTDPGASTTTGRQNTVYLQDAWRVTPNVTLKVGARYDEVAYRNDVGAEMADLGKLQPRLGLAWDITGNAKNVVKTSWGRYMLPATTSLPAYANAHLTTLYRMHSCSTEGGVTSPERCQSDAAGLDRTWIAGPDRWDPNGWYYDPAFDIFGSEPGRIVPGLRPAYSDELIVGFEREVARRTSVEVSYVAKATRDLIEDTCSGTLEGLTMYDPGYCPHYVIANLDGLRRDYHGVSLKLETRATDRMWLLASYTWSTWKGSLNYSAGNAQDFDFCPELCINRYGYKLGDRRHRVKLNSYFMLPASLTLGVDAIWESPYAYTKMQAAPNAPYGAEFLEPRGSRRANSNSQLDLSLTYRLNLGKVGAELIGSVVNAMGSEQAITVCEDINGCGDYAFSNATDWQRPRRFEVGFRLEF
jgi:hypothetical protein